MAVLMFLLSGEHPTLPSAEAQAAMQAEHKAFKVVEQFEQVLLAETGVNPEVLASRLSMTRGIYQHLCTVSAGDDILGAVGSSDLLDIIPHGRTFAVRITRIKNSAPHIDPIVLSREIADMIASEIEFTVDLTHPQVELLGVLTGEVCVFGTSLASVDRKQFLRRRPSARPAFHPSTLPPILSRCMVNLARTPRRGTFMDPFCGVGGILIEAGLIGATLIGVDAEKEMIEGSRKNLEAFGITNFQLMVGDARKLPPVKADAVATDPPYGRQASTMGSELVKLYREAIPSIAEILKEKGYLCITSPDGVELEDIAAGVGFRLIESHEQRVHRSLTRKVQVFRRKKG
ncbi:MAG: methyltransferase domain-containing protein [Candidatus Hadarchaeales archaeon]